MRVLAFVDDLMDRSRILAARPDVEFVRSLPGDEDGSTVVVVDGGRPSHLGRVEQLVSAGCRVVVFVPHVENAAADQARRAGAAVLSRSRFFRDVAAGIATANAERQEDTDR